MDITIIMSFSPSGSAGEYKVEDKSGVFFEDKVSQSALKHEMLRLQAEDPSRHFVTLSLMPNQVNQIRTKCRLK